MKTKIENLNNSKIPIIAFDKELEKLQDKVLFPEKLEMANKTLARVGLPKAKK